MQLKSAMKLLPTIIFLCVLVSVSTQSILKVSIYYGSLCSDSIKFITKQLYPCYQKLQKYIYVDFVPYGKVEVSFANGSYVYKCQFGKEECYGSRMQACALAQTQNQTVAVEFVNCVMSSKNPALASTIYECAVTGGLSWDAIEKCESCMDGQRLFAYHGYRTQFFVPNIKFVPTIVYNDRFNEKLQEEAYTDFCETTTKIIQYLISLYYPYPWCKCGDMFPSFPSQCCGATQVNPRYQGCNWCNLYYGRGFGNNYLGNNYLGGYSG